MSFIKKRIKKHLKKIKKTRAKKKQIEREIKEAADIEYWKTYKQQKRKIAVKKARTRARQAAKPKSFLEGFTLFEEPTKTKKKKKKQPSIYDLI